MSTTATRKPTKSAANRTALREAVAALNEGRHEDYLALFDPEARLHGFQAGIADVEDLVRFHAVTADAYPDATVTLDDAIAERDRVATRFTWRATQGPGTSLVANGGAIMRFADGQIVECWNLPTELRAVAA
jgi:predicted SnoaL-like aldol condensation-catalyzing enzyme